MKKQYTQPELESKRLLSMETVAAGTLSSEDDNELDISDWS